MKNISTMVIIWTLCVHSVYCQSVPPPAQTIQLPSVSNFSINTSVLVPDQGSASLGGINRSASGSNARSGIPTNRSIGSSTSSSGASVHVQIIDLDALDKAILGAATIGTQSTQGTKRDISIAVDAIDANLPNAAAELAAYIRGQSQTKRVPEYAYMLAVHEASSKTIKKYEPNSDDVKYFLLQARQAKRDGRWSAADVFMQQAWQRLTPQGQQMIIEALKEKEAKMLADAKASDKKPTTR